MEIALAEAKARLSELIVMVEGGESMIITKKGRPVARLFPYQEVPLSIDDAVTRLRDIQSNATQKQTLSMDDIQRLIEQGRVKP